MLLLRAELLLGVQRDVVQADDVSSLPLDIFHSDQSVLLHLL